MIMRFTLVSRILVVVSTFLLLERIDSWTSPAIVRHNDRSSSMRMRMAVADQIKTGPEGKAALNQEDDLRLTLAIIMDHVARSTTVSKDQFLLQMEDMMNTEDTVSYDVTVPYDAAAKLAYDKISDPSIPYDTFKVQYEAKAVADVIAKRQQQEPPKVEPPKPAVKEVAVAKVDVTVPYDAAAKLAYEKSDQTMAYDAFKVKYEADAVADVIAKKAPKSKQSPPVPVAATTTTNDVSVPYDAAAKLAYGQSDQTMSYPDFKVQYEADAVADVISKRKVLQQ